MTFSRYIKDRGIFILSNFLIYVCLIFLGKIIDISGNSLALIGFIWFGPLFIYIVLEYFKVNRFYKELKEVSESIELKFLNTEIINRPTFAEGEVIHDIMRESNRSMHEKVKFYENKQKEYQEYMDMWIHEIKTPIAGTRLIIENEDGKVKNQINREVDKIDKMVEQVLYYSKMDKANEDYRIRRVQAKEIIMNTVKANSIEFIMKKIKINVGDIEEEIFTDKKWLEFILNQIVGNALKYTRENGEIQIQGNRLKNSFELIIEDNGVGITEKDLKKIFIKGFTGENGRVFGKSTGMGLYICKSLCEKLNIGLEVTSHKGTKVKLTIPKGENTNIF